VKSNDVRAEDAAQDFRPPGRNAEHIFGGKRNVQEEADARVRQLASNHFRDEQQMVIVNPDHVAIPVLGNDRAREALVDSAVDIPVRNSEWQAVDLIVEQRPEYAIANAVIVRRGFTGREVHRPDSPLLHAVGERGPLRGG